MCSLSLSLVSTQARLGVQEKRLAQLVLAGGSQGDNSKLFFALDHSSTQIIEIRCDHLSPTSGLAFLGHPLHRASVWAKAHLRN